MKKSLLFVFILALIFNLVKAEDNTVTIQEINGIDASKDTTIALMLGTKINVKATYNNVDSVTGVTVALVNSGVGWNGPWLGTDYVVDTITGKIDIMLPVKADFPQYNIPEGKNTIQFVQVKVQYKSGLKNPYKLVRITKASEMDKVVITQVGSFVFPDTTTAKEVAKVDPVAVKAYYTNPEKVTSVQVHLTNSTNWATDWKGASVTIEPPYTGEIDTAITLPEDFPIYNFPEGKNNIQYVQVKVTYEESGLIQPYELVRVTGEAIIVESIEDYLTSLYVTVNDDTTKYMHSGWTVVGDRTTGDMFHFKGTYEAERNGNKATKISLGIIEFKGDWSGQNYSFTTEVASEAQNNLNGIIDYKIRIPHFYPSDLLVTEDTKGDSHQMAQIRVTYNDDPGQPIKGGIYSNFWMDILENTNKPSTCMDVGGITLSDITNSSVAIDWDLGNDAAWDILIAPAGEIRNPDASEDFVSVGAKPFVYSGLKAGTDYEMYIRTVCNNDTLNYQAGAYSEKMTFKTTGTVGLKTLAADLLNVYPNPANNSLTIDADKAYEITILDITGRTVMTSLMTDKREVLNVSDLKQGMYIINLGNREERISKTFIKR